MMIVHSMTTPIFGYLVTTDRYHDDKNRIIDLYLTTIKSEVPAALPEIFQGFHKTSMVFSAAILSHEDAVEFVEFYINR